MTKILQFKKLKVINHFKKIRGRFNTSLHSKNNVAETYAKFTRVKARSLQKNAPKKPAKRLGLYGNYKLYTPKQYEKRVAKHGRSVRGFWQKGLYSRPGHPPFVQTREGFNLRKIIYKPIGTPSNPLLKGTLRRGSPSLGVASARVKSRWEAYRIGPMSRNNSPVPRLHEYGGTVNLSGRSTRYETRTGMIIRRKERYRATYPPRPYMKPGSEKGIEEAKKKMKKLAGGKIKPTRVRLAS